MFRCLLLAAVAVVSTGIDVEKVTDTFSDAERAQMETGAETHKFEAEVNRLMDIIIHSLYSNRDVFLRELISNAADATDKLRFKALTDTSLLSDADDLSIKIAVNKDENTLTITDKGVGMTKQDLLNNLGVVAKSGTTEFLEAAAKGNDPLSLIGQFGVGFYSVYLVADKVTVCSKHNDDPDQHVWESTANQVFTVAKDPRGNTLGRGTSITLYLKEDATEYLNNNKLEEIIMKYSQFVDVPILTEKSKEVEEEVPLDDDEIAAIEAEEAEEAAAKAAQGDDEDDELEVTDEEDEAATKEPRSRTKTIKKTVTNWESVNKLKPIWTRSPSEVTDEEHSEFFKSLNKGSYGSYLEKIHFTASGSEVSFKALLYIQEKADHDRYNKMLQGKTKGVKLYVRKVLISDEFDEFLPKYMDSFVKGVVDSDDLPINVSRETLAQNRVLKVIAKKLQRKVLDVLRRMAEGEEEDADEDESEEAVQEEKEEAEEKEEKEDEYEKFWEVHGASIKYGVVEDRKNKAKLSKLLRYQTSKSEEKFVSLESYVERMPEDQDKIYYFNCESVEKCKASPFVEKVLKKGYEVIWMTEVIDEYITQHLTEVDGVELQSVVRNNMNLDKDDKKAFKQLKEEFKPVAEYLKETYGSRVSEVKVSNKLDQSPCVVTSSNYGWSANMERIMKAQVVGAGSQGFQSAKTLEINPRHPIIKALKEHIEADNGDQVKDLVQLLLDGALVNSGYSLDDLQDLAERTNRIVTKNLGVSPDAVAEEEREDVEEEEEEEEEIEEPDEEVEAEEVPAHSEL